MEQNELSQRAWLAIGLVLALGIGIVMVLLGVGVLARQAGPATSTPTLMPTPSVWLSPTEGGPGTVVAVAGEGWQPGDTVLVRLNNLSSGDQPPLATATVGANGFFATSFVFPSDPLWASPATILVTAWSSATGVAASASFQVLEQPTPVLTPTTVPTVAPTLPAPTSTSAPVPPPSPTSTPAAAGWRGEYFGVRDLTGAPSLVRDDAAIDFDWGSGVPANGLPADRFSVRWTRSLSFQGGVHRFSVYADDGVRVWLDGELIVDQWHDAAGATYTVERTLTAGTHSLRVEYYENTGQARIRFWFERADEFPQWRGEYFSRVDLVGVPVLIRNDAAIDFVWGTAAPASGLPTDGFSVRWTRTMNFEEGRYRFHVIVDDGARLYVDDALVVDSWVDGAQRELTADRTLAAGSHSLRVEYYERSGQAAIRVWWEKITTYPDWRGDYWSNRDLSGNPALTRNDATIDFDWGIGAPATGLPADGFSARWTRNASFEMGTYRFHILVDDGARLWVDNHLLIDDWRDGGARELTADYAMTQGAHSLRVEYYENTGQARVRVWWEKLTLPAYPDWRGEYWSNQTLSGNPTLVRNDTAVDFQWGTGSPATGIPADGFSVRWSRDVTFVPGVYIFYAWSDDGIRFYLDGSLLMNEWHSSSGQTVYAVSATLAGPHALAVEYYEHTGNALVRFWWARTGDWPTSTPLPPTATPTVAPPTATPTPTSTPLPPTATPTVPPVTSTPTVPPVTPTPTAAPPTATSTPEPPTATPTGVPPTAVPPTATALPPTPTVPPVTPTSPPGQPSPTPTPTLPPVRLNELLSAPRSVDWNQDGVVNDGDEWIELYNSQTVTVDLGGWQLGMAVSLQPPYRIPTGTLVSPGGYVVFYHQQTGIALPNIGGELRLRNANGVVVDRVIFPPLAADASYSRDTVGGWHAGWPPTPGQPNVPPVTTPTPQATPRWRFPIRFRWP